MSEFADLKQTGPKGDFETRLVTAMKECGAWDKLGCVVVARHSREPIDVQPITGSSFIGDGGSGF